MEGFKKIGKGLYTDEKGNIGKLTPTGRGGWYIQPLDKLPNKVRRGEDDLDYNDLIKKAEAKIKYPENYIKSKKIRDAYLAEEGYYKTKEQPEADDIWYPGYKESMKQQVKNYIQNKGNDDYDMNKVSNTLATASGNKGSLHYKFLSKGGEFDEAMQRETYGNEKVDSAIMREQELFRKGYTDVSTDLQPRGLVSSFDYSDMVVRGTKDGVEVSFNYNKKGETGISLNGRDKLGASDLIITDENRKTVSDIINTGGIGGFDNYTYDKYNFKKLTNEEREQYLDKVNKHYEKYRDTHYYDNDFFRKYEEKVKDDIISNRKEDTITKDRSLGLSEKELNNLKNIGRGQQAKTIDKLNDDYEQFIEKNNIDKVDYEDYVNRRSKINPNKYNSLEEYDNAVRSEYLKHPRYSKKEALKKDIAKQVIEAENNMNTARAEAGKRELARLNKKPSTYEQLKEHILEHYTKDYGYDAESPEKALKDQLNYMRYGNKTDSELGAEIAGGGSYLVYNEDMRNFLDKAGIGYKEGEEFDTYKTVVGRATAQIVREYDEAQSELQNQRVKKLANEIKETQRQYSNDKINSMSIGKLRTLAREYNIDTKGLNKSEIVARLKTIFNK